VPGTRVPFQGTHDTFSDEKFLQTMPIADCDPVDNGTAVPGT